MTVINKLDPSVYNLISAGEVVENPSSIVKELVENAIDAGATQISVYIERGGIDRIKIVDDGCGMSKDDLYLAYLPHATSKISCSLDLDNISTLGFRGEALASIAAVSKLSIESKQNGADIGYMVKVASGEVIEEHEVGLSQGTIITVDNIFYNTPVRLKFLKTPKQEESYVTNKMKQLILANPEIKFKYIVDDKLTYQTAGGLEDAIYAIYGTQIANNLIPFDFSYNGYRAYGYTSNVDTTRANKQYQTIIVNGRAINSANIQVAVMQAYGQRLMKRTYPIYVLNLVVPFDEIDVNVHPAKSEVRFRDDHKVFSCIYRAILSVLDNAHKTVQLCDISNTPNEHKFNNLNRTSVRYDDEQNKTNVLETNQPTSIKLPILDLNTSNFDLENGSKNTSSLENVQNTYIKSTFKNSNNVNYSSIIKSQDNSFKKSTSNLPKIEDNVLHEQTIGADAYAIVGQIFETYLIIQDKSKVYLIDQHACHEKFLFERLIDSYDKKEIASQPLLIPFTYTCTPVQYDCMKMLEENLNRLGFNIEEFGSLTFKFNEVPMDLANMNLNKFFEEILNDKYVVKSLKTSDLVITKLAQYACKAAVKAGDRLTDKQIRVLLDSMKNGVPMQCPHGRPCIFEYTRKDLDKLFKRIE